MNRYKHFYSKCWCILYVLYMYLYLWMHFCWLCVWYCLVLFKWMFMYTIMSCVYYIHNVYTCMHHIIDIENISMINSINDSLITLERTMVPNTCPWRRGKKKTGSGICWTLQCPSSWTNTRRRTSIWWTTPQWAWQV